MCSLRIPARQRSLNYVYRHHNLLIRVKDDLKIDLESTGSPDFLYRKLWRSICFFKFHESQSVEKKIFICDCFLSKFGQFFLFNSGSILEKYGIMRQGICFFLSLRSKKNGKRDDLKIGLKSTESPDFSYRKKVMA